MNGVASVVTAERAGGSPRPANRQQSLPNLDPPPELKLNEAGSRSGGDELNSTDSAEDDEKKPRPAKRKQPWPNTQEAQAPSPGELFLLA